MTSLRVITNLNVLEEGSQVDRTWSVIVVDEICGRRSHLNVILRAVGDHDIDRDVWDFGVDLLTRVIIRNVERRYDQAVWHDSNLNICSSWCF